MTAPKRSRSSLVVAVLAASFLLFAGEALATNSSIDQYTEGTPGAEGEFHGGASGDGRLPADVRNEFRDYGSAGVAAAALAEGTAPSARVSGSDDDGQEGKDSAGGSGYAGQSGSASAEGSDGDGASAIDLVGSGSGGMGVALPLILIVAAIAALALVLIRSRTHRPTET